MAMKKITPASADYVLTNRVGMFFCRNGKGFVSNILYAKLFKTWESANKACDGKNWKFCQVSELEQQD